MNSKFIVIRVGDNYVKSEVSPTFTCTYQVGSVDVSQYQATFELSIHGISVVVLEIFEFSSDIECQNYALANEAYCSNFIDPKYLKSAPTLENRFVNLHL